MSERERPWSDAFWDDHELDMRDPEYREGFTEGRRGLVDFLLARNAEDEERWQSAKWTGGEGGSAGMAYGRAVLACRAIRRIVEQYLTAEIAAAQHDATIHDRNARTVLRGTLEILSDVYVDHPDYREEWR